MDLSHPADRNVRPPQERRGTCAPPREKGFENADPLLSQQSGMMLCEPSQDDRPELLGLP